MKSDDSDDNEGIPQLDGTSDDKKRKFVLSTCRRFEFSELISDHHASLFLRLLQSAAFKLWFVVADAVVYYR
jgi:hypothetical protein